MAGPDGGTLTAATLQRARARTAARTAPTEKASATGIGVALVALALALSAIPSLRPQVGGFSVHPFLVILVFLVPNVLAAVAKAPPRLLAGVFSFSIWYFLSMLPEGIALGESIKFGAAIITTLAAVVLVKSERDFVVTVVALGVALSIISGRGLVLGALGLAPDPMGGINILQGIGNKNAFSLYALPTLLLVGWVATRMRHRYFERYLLFTSLGLVTLALFACANRSGWLGAVLIGLFLMAGRLSARTIVAVGGAALLAYGAMELNDETRGMFRRRIDATVSQENSSDAVRIDMLKASFELGMENPIFGVSPQLMTHRLARRMKVDDVFEDIDPHNVYAYAFAGSGAPGIITLLAMLLTFAFPYPVGRVRGLTAPALAKMMTALWLFRGFFTHEILFAPTFAIGIGLSIALVSIQLRERAGKGTAPAPRPRPPPGSARRMMVAP